MSEEVSTSNEENRDDVDQEIVTLGEVLQKEQQMLEDATAVLGVLDDKKCTYSEGYMKRQALYSCLTCIPESKTDVSKAAGICLACCYYCHEGHELIELYTKRNFRCDCGNGKFTNGVCNLDNSKSEINEFNEYNQNFCGMYCTCKRPYPDVEDIISDEMIQCVICEDWFHSRHLGVEIPPHNTFFEMSCEKCIKKHPFLLYYDDFCVNKTIGEKKVEVTSEDMDSSISSDMGMPSEVSNDSKNVEVGTVNDLVKTPESSTKLFLNDHELKNKMLECNTLENNKSCKKPKTKSELISTKFWLFSDWRKKLCTCSECIKMYEKEKVMFLTDTQDTVLVYEEKGKEKAREFQAKQEETDMKFLNSLDRVPLMEALAGYNDLKVNLMEYLKKFAENKKVVREEDIKEFFAKYDTKKKQKCEIPYYCR